MVWFILTCIVVTMKTTRVAILPIFPPLPLPMLKRKRTESEKVGHQIRLELVFILLPHLPQ